MKVLFLDFDGVLNNGSFLNEKGNHIQMFEKSKPSERLNLMNHFVRDENIQEFKKAMDQILYVNIVISSNWGDYYNLKNFKDFLSHHKISNNILDITPRKMSSTKIEEIGFFLNDNPLVEKFLIIDDDHVNFWSPEKVLLQTDNLLGFTKEDGLKVVSFFNNEKVFFKNEKKGLL